MDTQVVNEYGLKQREKSYHYQQNMVRDNKNRYSNNKLLMYDKSAYEQHAKSMNAISLKVNRQEIKEMEEERKIQEIKISGPWETNQEIIDRTNQTISCEIFDPNSLHKNSQSSNQNQNQQNRNSVLSINKHYNNDANSMNSYNNIKNSNPNNSMKSLNGFQFKVAIYDKDYEKSGNMRFYEAGKYDLSFPQLNTNNKFSQNSSIYYGQEQQEQGQLSRSQIQLKNQRQNASLDKSYLKNSSYNNSSNNNNGFLPRIVQNKSFSHKNSNNNSVYSINNQNQDNLKVFDQSGNADVQKMKVMFPASSQKYKIVDGKMIPISTAKKQQNNANYFKSPQEKYNEMVEQQIKAERDKIERALKIKEYRQKMQLQDRENDEQEREKRRQLRQQEEERKKQEQIIKRENELKWEQEQEEFRMKREKKLMHLQSNKEKEMQMLQQAQLEKQALLEQEGQLRKQKMAENEQERKRRLKLEDEQKQEILLKQKKEEEERRKYEDFKREQDRLRNLKEYERIRQEQDQLKDKYKMEQDEYALERERYKLEMEQRNQEKKQRELEEIEKKRKREEEYKLQREKMKEQKQKEFEEKLRLEEEKKKEMYGKYKQEQEAKQKKMTDEREKVQKEIEERKKKMEENKKKMKETEEQKKEQEYKKRKEEEIQKLKKIEEEKKKKQQEEENKKKQLEDEKKKKQESEKLKKKQEEELKKKKIQEEIEKKKKQDEELEKKKKLQEEQKKIKEEEEKKKKNPKGGLVFALTSLEGFKDKSQGIGVDFCVVSNNGIQMDRKNQPIQVESEDIYELNNLNIVQMDYINQIFMNPYQFQEQNKNNFEQFSILISLVTEDLQGEGDGDTLGWLSIPIFEKNGNVREGVFTETVYKMPLQNKFPIDQKNVKKGVTKLTYGLKYQVLNS